MTAYGWLSEGFHWDQAAKEPTLMLAVGSSKARSDRDVWSAAKPRWILQRARQFLFRDVGRVSNRKRFGDADAERHLFVRDRFKALTSLSPGTVSTSFKQALVVAGGSAYLLPLSEKWSEKLHILPQQSTFVLDFAKPTPVSYDANKSATFTLKLATTDWFDQNQSVFDADSRSGEFTVKIDKEKLLTAARRRFSTAEQISKHTELVSASFEQAVGRKPKGLPFVLHASISAKTEDEQFGGRHLCFVEIPLSELAATKKTK